MGIRRGKPNMKTITRILSIITLMALLAGCVPAPTAMPTATFTTQPTVTPTLTLVPESTPTAKVEVPLEQRPATIDAATGFARAMTDAGIPTTAEQILGQGLVIEQHEENGNKFEVATSQGFPLMIRMEEGEWEKATTKLFAEIANLNWGASTTISYTQNWSPESTTVVPILTNDGNRFFIDYDLMMYNPDYPDISVRPDEETYNFKQIDLITKFAKENNLTLQAQSLLVSIPQFTPPWIKEITDPAILLTIT